LCCKQCFKSQLMGIRLEYRLQPADGPENAA
jgi:hypothetical protein